jgi:hypothetical protein
MNSISLSKEEQGVVVFHLWKSLPYGLRMFLSFFLISVGFIIQYYGNLWMGLLFVFGGNLLLLVKGYDNRVKLGKYSAEGEWVKTDKEHLQDIVEINKKLKKWDQSPFDITNSGGIALFIFISLSLFIMYTIAISEYNYTLEFLAIDIAFLFFPHWFSGLKRITTTPLLMQKIAIYNKLMKQHEELLKDKKISFMIYVKGEDVKLPNDVKMKVDFNNQPESFMGMYAQISLNNVQGKLYPYFYVVLVAKKELDINNKYFNSINVSKPIIKEKSTENNMDIIIIRQYTTKTGGYFTKPKAINKIFSKGLEAAELIIRNETSV